MTPSARSLVEIAGKKFEAKNKEQARKAAELLGFLLDKDNTVEDPEAKGRRATSRPSPAGSANARHSRCARSRPSARPGKPPGPFITSTLQQAASSRLSFGAQKTMRAAQTLYEGGHITYMRTDSTNLSPEALSMARTYIGKTFGDKYVPEKPNYYASSNKGAQEAHEAIRPTDAAFTPKGRARGSSARREQALSDHLESVPRLPDAAGGVRPGRRRRSPRRRRKATPVFRANGRKLVFDGFMRVAGISSEDQLLPELLENKNVFPIEINPTQHFTQPPARVLGGDAGEEAGGGGIGRPSTYASIIQTIQDREYVTQKDRRFYATMLGSVVTDKLIQLSPTS
jgi:DNA topoisomerase-1